VSYYRGEAKSVLATWRNFNLNLTGKATAEAFTVRGHVFANPTWPSRSRARSRRTCSVDRFLWGSAGADFRPSFPVLH